MFLHGGSEKVLALIKTKAVEVYPNITVETYSPPYKPEFTDRVLVPSDEMNRVFLLLHMYRHVFSEGIGLRQMMDYALLLNRGCGDRYSRYGTGGGGI